MKTKIESVRNLIRYSAWRLVGNSVRGPVVSNSVRGLVSNSIWDSVGNSIWWLVRNSVQDDINENKD